MRLRDWRDGLVSGNVARASQMRLSLLGLGCLFSVVAACGSTASSPGHGSAGTATEGGNGITSLGGEAGEAGTTQGLEGGNGAQGSSGANGGHAGSSALDGCARVVAVLPPDDDTHNWRSMENLPGGVWRTSAGLHHAFAGRYNTAHPLGLPYAFVRQTIVVETFDLETTELLDLRLFDVFPAHLSHDNQQANGVAASPDGRFLLTYGWYDPETKTTPQRALIADVADPNLHVEVELLAGVVPEPLLSQAGWDGEAFVVHAYDSQVYSMRVSLEGEIIQPLEPFGSGMGVGFGELAHQVSTNPSSGVSFVMSSRRIAAHGRDGEPLPWMPAEGFKELSFRESAGSVPRARAAADDAGGAWLLWTEDLIESLGGPHAAVAHVGPDGEPDVYHEFILDSGFPPTYYAPLARRDGSAWLAVGDEMQLFLRTVEDGELGPPVLQFDASNSNSKFGSGGLFALTGLEWQDEVWLSFFENRSDIVHSRQALRVHPDCVYDALPGP